MALKKEYTQMTDTGGRNNTTVGLSYDPVAARKTASSGGSTVHQSSSGNIHGGSSGSFGSGDDTSAALVTGAITSGLSKAASGNLNKNLGGGDLNKNLGGNTGGGGNGGENGGGGGGASAAPAAAASAPQMKDVAANNLMQGPNVDGGAMPTFGYEAGDTPVFDYQGNIIGFRNAGADPAFQEQYQKTMAALEQMKGQTPVYGSQYDAQIQDLYQQILGRGKFQYDSKTDPLYQQYVQDYTQLGKQAAKDTMGMAAGLTGGYGSSYSQAVGQQTYDQYLQRLADVLPETYGMALDAWKAEGDQINQKLATTMELEQSDYGRYLDRLSQYNRDMDAARSDADTAYNRMMQADETAYNRAMDEYKRGLAEDETAYARAQDAYNRQLMADETAYARASDAYNRELAENKLAYDRSLDKYDYQLQTDKYNRQLQDDYYNRLLGLMSVGYTPTAQDYANAGLTVAQGEQIRSSYASGEPEARTLYVNRATTPAADTESQLADAIGKYLGGNTSDKPSTTSTSERDVEAAVKAAVEKLKAKMK